MDAPTATIDTTTIAAHDVTVKLNIAILSLGSRGDLQPHLAIAKALQAHGHRVRLVCSALYRSQVEAAGVDFFCYGAMDPTEMARRRLLPREEQKKLLSAMKAEFAESAAQYWKACIGDDGDVEEGQEREPFLADAVISIMQPFVHSWIAARMGIPLHMIGTNPRSPTRYLPHSQDEGAAAGDSVLKNKLSWFIRDLIFLQLMRTSYNAFRLRIGLEPFTPLWYTSQWNRLCVPFTNIWSPNFLPKPKDWGNHIDVVGYVFQETPDYHPPADLAAFLEAGDTPIYIGFGSAWLPDSQRIFKEIFSAVSKAGVRAVVLRGFAEFDPEDEANPNVFVVNDCPHGWLFPRMSAVLVHGGAGATAMALKTGRPTLVCPVSGDMPFWGNRVWKSGCGPEPLPYKSITADVLAERIKQVLQPEYAAVAADMAAKIASEEPGEEAFARSALKTFGVYEKEARCDVLPDKPAAWLYIGAQKTFKLSAVAAHILMQGKMISRAGIVPLELVKWPDLVSPGDPVTGLMKSVGKVIKNIRRDVSRMSGKRPDEFTEKVTEPSTHAKNSNAVLLGVLFLIAHVLRAPLTILNFVLFGFYNLIDFTSYELGSHTNPDLFASNPRLYSYPQMLGFLLLKPFKELGSVSQRPAQFPLAILRFFIAMLNILVGLFALTIRAGDIGLSRLMDERPRTDVVVEARLRYGKIEAEWLGRQNVEEGVSLIDVVHKAWIKKTSYRKIHRSR